jgi:ElaB/YqjD/DUF883 family membrane-anchored ribosome-binding protein
MIETIKQNPIPAALVGIGLGWMFFKHQSASADTRSSRSYGAYGGGWAEGGWTDREAYGRGQRFSYQPAHAVDFDDAGRFQEQRQSGAAQTMDRVQDRAGQVVDQVQGSAGQMVDRVQERAGQFVDQAQSMTGQVADQAQQTAGQIAGVVQDRTQRAAGTVQGQFQRMLSESPLMLGGLALAAGLAMGLTIPETAKEDELLGEARDSVMQQAKGVVQDTQQKLQQVGQEAGRAAREEAREQQLTS